MCVYPCVSQELKDLREYADACVTRGLKSDCVAVKLARRAEKMLGVGRGGRALWDGGASLVLFFFFSFLLLCVCVCVRVSNDIMKQIVVPVGAFNSSACIFAVTDLRSHNKKEKFHQRIN